jgi:hypothetical protein
MACDREPRERDGPRYSAYDSYNAAPGGQ